jgi:hypothetical protein
MKSIIICCLLFLFLQTVKSQDSLAKPVVYNMVVKPFKSAVFKGYLATIADSAVYLSQLKTPVSFARTDVSDLQRISYKNIDFVQLYNRKKRTTTIVVSVLVCAAVGAIIGGASGNDPGSDWLLGLTAGEKAVVGAVIGAGTGAIIGTVVTQASKKKFLINGEWKTLEEMKASLQR